MRVLMTADTVGGVWTYALEAAAALAPGVDLELATMGRPPDADQRAAASATPLAGLHVSSYALEWEDEPWDDVERAGAWLLGLAEDVDADLVHLNGYAHAALAWHVPVVVAAHSDVVSWWRAVEGTPMPRRLGTYRERVRKGLLHADAVCAPTRAVLDDLAASFGYAGAGFVVPNAVSPSSAASRKQPLVVGLGRFWDRAKNVAALERATGRVPWRVLVAGPGTPAGRLSRAESAALLSRASIFASPARYEPFGLAALEAAQAGCALVLGDLPSQREVWGAAAVYVPPDDDEAIAAALTELCTDDDLRSELAARAQARAALYTPEAMAERLLSVYAVVRAPGRAAA